MKKFLFLFIAVFLMFGCGTQKQSSDTISVWHWMTDRHEAFVELAARYKEETGVTVQFDVYAPSDAFSQRVIASAQARTLPDIYGILDKKEIVAAFIKNGFVADLTEDFKADDAAWESSFFEKAVDVNRFKADNIYGIPEGIYGVPLDVTNIQMLYNKKLLKKAGIDSYPKTFEEFILAAEALNRVGLSAFVSGWGEMWMIDAFASNYAFNIMGEEKIMATYRGEVSYTDPDWIKVFQIFETLRTSNALAEGIVTKPNKEAEQDFALERAAFAFNGSWCVNVYHNMNPDLDYGVMPPPPVSKERPLMIWGGAGSSFVVNNTTPNKEKAIAFLKWLTAKEQQAYLSEKTRNLPANRQALSSISDVLSDFAKGMDQTTHPTTWKYNEKALVIEKFDKGIQSILIGEKTPEEIAYEVQERKDKEVAKEAARNASR